MNPAKLSAERRDSICMQCHLEGNAAVEQAGHTLNDFHPGDRLSDTVHYFVLEGGSNDGFRALSQTEALARSLCKRRSGDKMSCTSCHDPHASPSARRARDVLPRKMSVVPRRRVWGKASRQNSGLHAVPHAAHEHCRYRAHASYRPFDSASRYARPSRRKRSPPTAPHLVRFPPGDSADSDRDLALAWESVANSNKRCRA